MSESPRTFTPPLASEKIVNGRKIFFVDLKENARGRFLKITEDVGGRRDTILVPMVVAADVLEALQRLGEFEATLDQHIPVSGEA